MLIPAVTLPTSFRCCHMFPCALHSSALSTFKLSRTYWRYGHPLVTALYTNSLARHVRQILLYVNYIAHRSPANKVINAEATLRSAPVITALGFMKTLEIPVRKIQPEIPFCRCSWIGNDTTRIFPNINNRPDYVVFVNRRWFTAPCRNCVTYFRRVVAFAIRVIAFTSGVIPTFLSIAIRYHIVHRLFKSLTSKVSRKNLPAVDFPLLKVVTVRLVPTCAPLA